MLVYIIPNLKKRDNKFSEFMMIVTKVTNCTATQSKPFFSESVTLTVCLHIAPYCSGVCIKRLLKKTKFVANIIYFTLESL